VGLHLGFRDLVNEGFIKAVPRLIAVQSASCDPIYRAWADGSTTCRQFAKTKPRPKEFRSQRRSAAKDSASDPQYSGRCENRYRQPCVGYG
jgi:threonine synthase